MQLRDSSIVSMDYTQIYKPADLAAGYVPADTLADSTRIPYFIADTLNARIPVSPADIFGTSSVVVNSGTGAVPGILDMHLLVNNYVYEFFVLAVLGLCCYLLVNYRASVAQLFSDGFRDKILEDHTLLFRHFLAYGSLMGIMMGAALLVKVTDHFDAMAYFTDTLPPWAQWLACPAMAATLVLYLFYRRFIGGILGKVAMKETFFERYDFLWRICAVAFAFMLVVPFLLSSMVQSSYYQVFAWVMTAMAAAMYAFYLGRSYNFFTKRNVSILQWFLYLCAVEFLPLSFMLIVAVRYL